MILFASIFIVVCVAALALITERDVGDGGGALRLLVVLIEEVVVAVLADL